MFLDPLSRARNAPDVLTQHRVHDQRAHSARGQQPNGGKRQSPTPPVDDWVSGGSLIILYNVCSTTPIAISCLGTHCFIEIVSFCSAFSVVNCHAFALWEVALLEKENFQDSLRDFFICGTDHLRRSTFRLRHIN